MYTRTFIDKREKEIERDSALRNKEGIGNNNNNDELVKQLRDNLTFLEN